MTMKNAVALIKRHKKALLLLGALIALLFLNGYVENHYFANVPNHLKGI